MLCMHGGLYLAIKTESPIRERAIFCSKWSAIFTLLFFAMGGVWVTWFLPGYQVQGFIDPQGFSNPLHKKVIAKIGAWVLNYSHHPYFILLPVLGFLGALLSLLSSLKEKLRLAFICSAMSEIGIIGTVGVSMFPFVLPSSTQLNASLLVWDASSSKLTLLVMLMAACIFMPIILLYTSWVYHALRGKVTSQSVEDGDNHAVY